MYVSHATWLRRSVLGAAAVLFAVASVPASRAQAPSGAPIRIGQSLSLTGPLAQTGLVHKIVGDVFVDTLNKKGGLLGRPVEHVLLDDQSRPDVARTLYERLITSDKVDLILGPYATANILATMGVAQRYKKIFIQNTLGIPNLATYEWQFSALVAGDHPEKTLPAIVYDAYASTGHPPKTATIVTSKFPSAQFTAKGAQEVFTERGMNVQQFLEYEFGTRDFGAIAARVKDANSDLLLMGALGVEGNLLIEAMDKLGYRPPRQYYLFPAPVLANLPSAEGAMSFTNFEDSLPYTADPVSAEFARLFHERAEKAGLPFPHADSQAGLEYSAWQILIAAVQGTKSLDDAKLADWLDKNEVDTVVGRRNFKGKWHTSDKDLQRQRQVQGGKWITVWPRDVATPGAKLIAP